MPDAAPLSYQAFLSSSLRQRLLAQAEAVPDVPGMRGIDLGRGLETPDALAFLARLYRQTRADLQRVLIQRAKDRAFIDQRGRAIASYNQKLGIPFLDPAYRTVIGETDENGRVVVGPLREDYFAARGDAVAELPEHLRGSHVTLFGPPDTAKMAINAMNTFHRKLPKEPAIVDALLRDSTERPKWGADDEDSKTPLHRDLVDAGANLSACFAGQLSFEDGQRGKRYQLERDHLAIPIKRFPGLALPCTFLFVDDAPVPLHLYDFALHLFHHWSREEALSFYVPKLENEEEARYLHGMIASAETLLREHHPDYRAGSVRLMIVLENPRAVFRVNEIMDALYPYFAGASLGWHDYLASTARLFKTDPDYRIPVKADPYIVIKYIKASHELLSEVVGPRGGIKVGGMYGYLPTDSDLFGSSFQVTLRGYIKDVITQLKRDLTGFWVAHPDFVRIGLALQEAWYARLAGDDAPLRKLIEGLIREPDRDSLMAFIDGQDIASLDSRSPLYARSLLVADVFESNIIANHDHEEIRYNVFQSLQYLCDWLCGNGCVALPAQVEGEPIRIMDDLATAERSRWEVWHEVHHGRVRLEDLVRIAFEELRFIREDLSTDKKIIQVRWNEHTARWYPIAQRLMLKLMADPDPVEFASELLLPFCTAVIRDADDPWAEAGRLEGGKYRFSPDLERLLGAKPPDQFRETVVACLERHRIPAAALAVTDGSAIQELAFGPGGDGLFQVASLSKAVATAFSLELFRARGIALDSPVNEVLARVGSDFRLRHPAWGDRVRVRHLMAHAALNLHYVNGVPRDERMVDVRDLLEGNERYGYAPIEVIGPPGARFHYSGGGFLLLQHLVERLTGLPVAEATRSFLDGLGMSGYYFDPGAASGREHAQGRRESGEVIPGGYLQFPAFAAGASATAAAMLGFLAHLEAAYHSPDGSGGISHDTAVLMLHGQDRGSMDFMGARMGLGIFVAEAGDNLLALHQGANDGFRALFLHCVAGPDRGKGMVACATGELRAVHFISQVTQEWLRHFDLNGVDEAAFQSDFNTQGIDAEQVVNRGYKELVFQAFLPCLPEPIAERGRRDPLSRENLAVDARILSVSNQRFARAENLLSPCAPVFDPTLFGRQGKVMDSWESARHSPDGKEVLLLELAAPSRLTHARFCTRYHLGNHVEAVALFGRDDETDTWLELLPRFPLAGHSVATASLQESERAFRVLRLETYPDGGLSRLGLYCDPSVLPPDGAYSEPIPQVERPLTIAWSPTPAEIAANLARLHADEEADMACAAYGGVVEYASNEHYAPAHRLLSPFAPIHMFDGFESARSRAPGHNEEVLIRLGRRTQVHRVVFDFRYFVNNNPRAISLRAVDSTREWTLLDQMDVKAYAGNVLVWNVPAPTAMDKLRVLIYPDGGINRIHVYGRSTH